MAVAQTTNESILTELSLESYQGFCDDMNGMFGFEMACEQLEALQGNFDETLKSLGKLVTINIVRGKGGVNTKFPLVLDKTGMFVLGGNVVMLPEKKILQQAQIGKESDLENLHDPIKEVANLLVGSWDRVFRENLDAHEHFLKTDTYIGELGKWDSEDAENIHQEDVFTLIFEMTLPPFPNFKCAAVFPQSLLSKDIHAPAEEESETEEAAQEEDSPQATEEVTEVTEETKEEPAAEKAEEETPADSKEQTQPQATEESPEKQEDTAAEKASEESAAPQQEITEEQSEVTEEPAPQQSQADVPEEKPVESETSDQTTSQEIETFVKEQLSQQRETVASQPVSQNLSATAKEVMDKHLVWSSPDDSVQDILAKMQKENVGYVMIGKDNIADGIVSKSDIAGALSPYLKNVFSKWRRPLDDATLNIKAKWIMSRPVYAVNSDTPLLNIMEQICSSGKRCVPVMNKQGQLEGVVTVYDILRFVMNGQNGRISQGKSAQAPGLV